MADSPDAVTSLYMFYLGGNAGRSNIEVHDVQFAAVTHPQAAWPALREAWFGDADKLHIDGYSIIDWADGYDVCLMQQPAPLGAWQLYFVNVGAYVPETLAEQHAFGLYVAPDAATAKRRALAQCAPGWAQPHKDNLCAVDDCLPLSRIENWHVHLRANPDGRPVRPAWQGYQPIGTPRRARQPS